MSHPIFVYYIAHNDLPAADPFLPDPFTSDKEEVLLSGFGGTMRTAGRRLSSKYILRRLASHFLLNRIYGITSTDQLHIGIHGKPELSDSLRPGPSCAFFNLSHGKDYTVLAVSDAVCGIDIQEVPEEPTRDKKEKGRKKRELVALRSFPEEFRDIYLSASPDLEALVFTQLWTRTEAILKAEGTGFAYDLREHPDLIAKWHTETFSLEDHEITLALQGPFTWEISRIFPSVTEGIH